MQNQGKEQLAGKVFRNSSRKFWKNYLENLNKYGYTV